MKTEKVTRCEIELFKSFSNGLNVGEQQMLFANNVLFVWNGKNTDICKWDYCAEIGTKLYGIEFNELNNSFHKSFATVADMCAEEYYAHQILHYFTTYGLESIGIKTEAYIPNEVLGLPETETPIKVTVIRAVSDEEMRKRVWDFCCRPVAVSSLTLEKVCVLLDYYFGKDYLLNHIDEIKNREIKLFIRKKYNIIPLNDGDEFMKFLCYTVTSQSCVIKNSDLTERLKWSNVSEYFVNYVKNNPMLIDLMATCYNRWKSAFMAIKTNKHSTNEDVRRIINKISKKSKKLHIPMKKDALMELTDTNIEFSEEQIRNLTKNTPTFRLVRILNALRYKYKDNSYNSYRIRNGKFFVKQSEQICSDCCETDLADIFYNKSILTKRVILICDIIKERVDTKKVLLIDENTKLAVPTTEKMFCGEYPCGSKIVFDKNNLDEGIVFGIWWENIDGNRVDLDLHVQNGKKSFGWDTSYKSCDDEIVFSGDMTDAPKPYGAAEYFRVGKNINDTFTVSINNFYCNEVEKVPFKFVIAKASAIGSHHVIDPSKIIYSYNGEIDKEGMTLGMLSLTKDQICFIFDNSKNNSTMVSRFTQYNELNMKVTIGKNYSMATLNTIFPVVNSVEQFNELYVDENGNTDKELVDLSAQSITKDAILGLFDKEI